MSQCSTLADWDPKGCLTASALGTEWWGEGAVPSEEDRLRRKNKFQCLLGCPGLEGDLNHAPEGLTDQWVEASGTSLRQGKKSPAGTVQHEVSGPGGRSS